MLHGNPPRRAIGLHAAGAHRAGAAMDQKIFEFVFLQQGCCLLQSVTFAHRAEIKHGAFSGELNGGLFWIKPELRPATMGPGLGEICFGRSGAGVIHETPAAHQRRESDVESSTGLFAKRNALLQQRKDLR